MEQIVKVTRNFQVTIPAVIRDKIGLKEGDIVKVIYDEREGVIKIVPIKRKRTTIKLGKSISVEEIEEAIEGMMSEAVTRY
ncbi:MAG: AbrB/MazE/SpoVT family DNA-binding domain-containing protein [Ignisphaera sp.]|jgi:antitoxin PrlF|nr:AbrB/MazE/SpoVT family DNA-binding domain-containing protein [Ignisphaera sp.]